MREWIFWFLLSFASASFAETQKEIRTPDTVLPETNSKANASSPQGDRSKSIDPTPYTLIVSPADSKHETDREKVLDVFNDKYLQTQSRMATAAERQNGVAWLAAGLVLLESVISAFALCFLIKTFRETKITARASIRAAHAAKQAAKAAHASARAQMGVALPNLILSHMDFGDMGAASLPAKIQSPKMNVVLVNYGNTFAIPRIQGLNIVCSKALPEKPIYQNINHLPVAGLVVEKGASFELFQANRVLFSNDEIDDIQQNKKHLWVYGFVLYEDVLGDHHERRFCQRLHLLKNNDHIFAMDPSTPKAYTASS